MNLDRASSGDPVTLGHPAVSRARARRLAEMGMRRGSTVTPLHRTSGGGRVVGIGVTRVAVAKTVLSRMALHGHGAAPQLDTAITGTSTVLTATAVARSSPRTIRGCHQDSGPGAPADAAIVALVGCPNVGKSTLFNALTGAKRQVGNWPGTTVEVGQGTWQVGERKLALVDLPGAYSLDPISPDERLTKALLIDAPEAEQPDLVVVVANAADAARGLYLLSQIRERPARVVLALTMTDVAERRGRSINLGALRQAIGVPVVALDPRRRHGTEALANVVTTALREPPPASIRHVIPEDEEPDLAVAEARFAWVGEAITAAVTDSGETRTWSDRIDRIVTSPVAGPLLFLAVMWAVFQVTTAGAAPLVDGLDQLFSGPLSAWASSLIAALGLGETWVQGLVVDGLIAGVGMVLTFVPLMAIMFLLLALLEDSGYLARAAVVTDRMMRVVGLPGRAFVPLIVGFGCNVPAISATRILPDARHRLLTALVVPFTSCSARLPVYVLVGAAIFGKDAGNIVFAMYIASIGLVLLGGTLLRLTVLRGVHQDPLVIDLPCYQVPVPRMLLAVTWTRLAAFLRTATGIIVIAVVGVWLLTAVPARSGVGGFGEVAVEDSAFAAASSVVAPVFAPAGFGDWHMAGALVVGFVAKEAVISSWAQTYAAEEPADLAAPGGLGEAVRADFTESSGGHPALAGFAFLLFVLGYAPCVATMTAQVREIGARWTLVGFGMGLAVSWTVAVGVFQIGRLFL